MKYVTLLICLFAMTTTGTAQDVGFARDDFGKVVLSGKQSFSGKLETSIGNYNNEPISKYGIDSLFARLGRPIGRLDVLTAKGVGTCTAFLISRKYIVTNHHCIPGNSGSRIEAAQLVMGYIQEGVEENTKKYTVSPIAIEKSEELDYAILEVLGAPSQKYGKLRITNAIPQNNSPYWIIGHPMGGSQRISREGCSSSTPAISGNRLRHKCDTLPGNSGSPVIDLSSQSVIALHHAGSSRESINFAIPFSKIIEQSPLLQNMMKKSNKTKVAVGVFPSQAEPIKRRLSFEPEVVHIPGGTFPMGCVSGKNCQRDEKPVHRVKVSSFYLSKYETTVGEFKAFTKESRHKVGSSCWTWERLNWKERSGRSFREPGFSQSDNEPVVCVSWKDAVAYAKWLSRKTGQKWRLPTEAEWEYAARGNREGSNKTKFHFGNRDTDLCKYGNVLDRTVRNNTKILDVVECNDAYSFGRTASVGSFKANHFGLHDMYGNVWEWVHDWKGKYKKRAQKDPKGPTSGSHRVRRGGSWAFEAKHQRSANRSKFPPGNSSCEVGFRLLRQP